jgi:hypothetical protein
MMDGKKIKETIEVFQDQIEWIKAITDAESEGLCEGCIEYFETAIEALEKQLPKKGIKEKITEGTHKGLHNFYCPVCYGNGDLSNKCNVGEYCSDCGQKLDWGK